MRLSELVAMFEDAYNELEDYRQIQYFQEVQMYRIEEAKKAYCEANNLDPELTWPDLYTVINWLWDELKKEKTRSKNATEQ